MGDNLVSEDYVLSVSMATKSEKHSKIRLGERMFDQQSKYTESLEKEKNKDVRRAIWRVANYGKMHQINEAVMSKIKGDMIRDNIPNMHQANFSVYEIVKFLMHMVRSANDRKMVRKEEIVLWDKCVQSAINRSGSQLTTKEATKYSEGFTNLKRSLACHTSIECFLEELNYKRVGEHNRMLKKMKRVKDECERYERKYDSSNSFDYSKRDRSICTEDFDMVVVGALRVFFVGGKTYVLTEVHYTRVLNYFRSLRKTMFSVKDLPFDDNGEMISSRIERMLYGVAELNCNAVGEVAKGARQMAILELEESEIIEKPKKMYKEAIDPVRASRAEVMLSVCKSIFPSLEVCSNVLGIYKAVPHPDVPLHDMFDTIMGVKEPNRCEKEFVDRFNGVLRRSLYSSMSMTGHDVRLSSKDDLGDKLCEVTNDITQNLSNSKKFSASSWSSTSFEIVRSVTSVLDMTVPIASKASSSGILMTTTQEQEARAYYAGFGDSIHSDLLKSTTVNDATEAIQGRNKLRIDRALKRFEKVISLHEKFESKFVGMEIEDIPSEALEKFLEDFPMAEYRVDTEGKFGEYHKIITRLFYIAEQELKAITQRVERLAKQVSRGQSGVSITKGFLGRRLDLESSVKCMTGSGNLQRSIAVSFDMSEFSKKFPMELVRIYGKILSEITGERYLERIDLFFRASKVMYAKRGFYSHLRGAKGGFEGFLNFIWSSIHAAIMEVALETTGVRGKLLTFSDDGLLIFYPKAGTPDRDIERLIYKIKSTYSSLGLEFHLGKTLVSDHMWEYLGDICYNNKLLPSWFKELVRVSNQNFTRGFTPLYDKIKTIDAQCTALVTAGGDPITSYILKRYECAKIIRSRLKKPNHLLEEALLILPPTCGGFRISSPYEDTVYSTIERDSEVFADLVLIDNIERGTYSKLSSAITMRMRKRTRVNYSCKGDITNSTIFKTDLPDTSGDSALRWLLDRVRESSGYMIPKDPLDGDISCEIVEILEKMECVDLNGISMLLSKVPGLAEYQAYLGVLKGNGALRIAKRDHVSEAQRKDSKNVKRSIQFWHEIINTQNIASKRNFIEYAISMTYPHIKVIPMRASPRIVLERTNKPDDAAIEVQYSSMSEPNIYEAKYVEPSLKAPADPSTLSWNSEATGDRTYRDKRMFLEIASRLISSYPSSENSIRAICRIFSLMPPKVLTTAPRGLHRSAGAKVRVTDARLILPRFHMSTINGRYLGRLAVYLNRKVRADRTSYLEGAKGMSYLLHTSYFPINTTQSGGNEFYYYKLNSKFYDNCFPTHEMRDGHESEVIGEGLDIGPKLAQEYLMSAAENELYIQKLRMLEIASTSDEAIDAEVSDLILTGMVSIVENFLNSRYNMTMSTVISDDMFPEIATFRNYIMRRAVFRSALSTLEPLVRDKLSFQVNKYNLDRDKSSLVSSEAYIKFVDRVIYVSGLIPPEISEMTHPIELESISEGYDEYLDILVSSLFDDSLLGTNRMVIFFAKDFKSNQTSNDHKVAYRKIIRETVKALNAAFKSVGWDKQEINRRYKSICNMDIDEQIDLLKVIYNIIRSSPHRGQPYNSKTAIMELTKFYILQSEVMKVYSRVGVEGKRTKDSLFEQYKDWTPNLLQQLFIKRSVNLPGEDHIRNITRSMKYGVIRRAISNAMRCVDYNVRNRAIGMNYDIKVEEIKQMQTTFKETLMNQAISKIKAYHYNVGGFIRKHFIKLTRNYIPVASLECNVNRAIGVDEFGTFSHEDVCRLIFNHLEIIKLENGLLGFKTHRELDGHLYDIVSESYGLEGMATAPIVGGLGTDSSYKVFDIMCKSIVEAFATYMHMCSDSRSSASIIKVDEVIEREVRIDAIMEEDEEEEYDEQDDPDQLEQDLESVENGEDEEEESESSSSSERSSSSSESVRWGDYSTSSDEPDDPIIIVPEGERERFRVIGVTSRMYPDIVEHSENVPEVRSDFTDSLIDIIDNRSVVDSLRETDSIISSLSSTNTATSRFVPSSYTLIQQSNAFTAGRQVNNRSSYLQASYELAREYDAGNMLFASYVLGLASFRGCKSTGEIVSLYTEVSRSYHNMKTRMRVTRDIASYIHWARNTDMVAGEKVKIRLVSSLKRHAISKLKNRNYTIPSEMTSLMSRDVEGIYLQVSTFGKPEIGLLSDYLYFNMAEEEDDSSDESEDEEFTLGSIDLDEDSDEYSDESSDNDY